MFHRGHLGGLGTGIHLSLLSTPEHRQLMVSVTSPHRLPGGTSSACSAVCEGPLNAQPHTWVTLEESLFSARWQLSQLLWVPASTGWISLEDAILLPSSLLSSLAFTFSWSPLLQCFVSLEAGNTILFFGLGLTLICNLFSTLGTVMRERGS